MSLGKGTSDRYQSILPESKYFCQRAGRSFPIQPLLEFAAHCFHSQPVAVLSRPCLGSSDDACFYARDPTTIGVAISDRPFAKGYRNSNLTDVDCPST